MTQSADDIRHGVKAPGKATGISTIIMSGTKYIENPNTQTLFRLFFN